MDFLEDVLNHLPDAICVINTKTDKVKYVNETFAAQLLPRAIIIGQSFENQILQESNRATFLDSLQQSKTSSDDIVIGLYKSLSTIGHDKCKCLFNFIMHNSH